MVADKIEQIKKLGKSSDPVAVKRVPDQERFDSLVNQEAATKQQATAAQQTDAPRQRTLMEEVRDLNYKVDQVRRTTPDDLVAQAKDIIGQIDHLKKTLAEPDVKIKSSARTLLRNKLTHIDESLQIALTKAGVEYVPPEEPTGLAAPMERFLGFLTHSEAQLETLANEVNAMHLRKEEIAPADMLLVQIKVTQVQQELEFFTALLNKALESTKTIMNVQV